MEKTGFTVKLERFEGPYTKLLDLIEGKKLSITEVSLVSVADDYLLYIKDLNQGSDKESFVDISQFIVVASTLILMKAKSLLPGVVYTEEEEKQVHDLERKLELYSILVASVGRIRNIYNKTPMYSRERISYKGGLVFVPDKRIDAKMLQSVALLTLATFISPKQIVKVVVDQAIRLETVIEKLLVRVRGMHSVTLQSLADGAKTIEERKKILIVNFIAMLELLRTGAINAEQNNRGGEIHINEVMNT
jgi:segregation and condensation protein A